MSIFNWLKPEELSAHILKTKGFHEHGTRDSKGILLKTVSKTGEEILFSCPITHEGIDLDLSIELCVECFSRILGKNKELIFCSIPEVRGRIINQAKSINKEMGIEMDNAIIYATAFVVGDAFS